MGEKYIDFMKNNYARLGLIPLALCIMGFVDSMIFDTAGLRIPLIIFVALWFLTEMIIRFGAKMLSNGIIICYHNLREKALTDEKSWNFLFENPELDKLFSDINIDFLMKRPALINVAVSYQKMNLLEELNEVFCSFISITSFCAFIIRTMDYSPIFQYGWGLSVYTFLLFIILFAGIIILRFSYVVFSMLMGLTYMGRVLMQKRRLDRLIKSGVIETLNEAVEKACEDSKRG